MSPDHRARWVLVVEDDADLAYIVREVLDIAGYAVALAGDGREGLRRLRERPSTKLVLLDLWMPVMNGWQFRAEQLRDPALAAIPVVTFSADDDAQRGASMGAVGNLRKPVSLDDLVTMVRRICGSPEAPS